MKKGTPVYSSKRNLVPVSRFKDSDFKESDKTSGNWGMVNFCVSVAFVGNTVAVRDTKDRKKATLRFDHDEWRAFIAGVKDGQFEV